MKKKTIVKVVTILLAVAAVSVFKLSDASSSPQTAESVSGVKVEADAAEQAVSNEKAEPRESVEVEKKQEQRTEKADSGNNRKVEPQGEKKENAVTIRQNTAPDKLNEQKPTHTHDWQEVYETAEQEIYGDRCKGCPFGTNEADKMYEHIDANPFDDCGSYATGAVVIRIEHTSIFAGYKCFCGATK